jgi:hypothetical protein
MRLYQTPEGHGPLLSPDKFFFAHNWLLMEIARCWSR